MRQKAWQTISDLWLSQRETLNGIYANLLTLRQQIAHNAGLANYRAYAFREKGRFDYTPDDCLTFHAAIETAVVPAIQRILKRKQKRLGYDTLRPWDWVPEKGHWWMTRVENRYGRIKARMHLYSIHSTFLTR